MGGGFLHRATLYVVQFRLIITCQFPPKKAVEKDHPSVVLNVRWSLIRRFYFMLYIHSHSNTVNFNKYSGTSTKRPHVSHLHMRWNLTRGSIICCAVNSLYNTVNFQQIHGTSLKRPLIVVLTVRWSLTMGMLHSLVSQYNAVKFQQIL